MPTDIISAHTCPHTTERLESAFWSRVSPDRADAEHAASCRSCGELMEALAVLADSLATQHTPELSADRFRSVQQLAARELSHSLVPVGSVAPQPLPSGYSRELVRILGWALLPLPLALFTYVQLFQLGGALLGQILPDWAVVAVGITAVSGAASWLAVVYGSIPLVAYRRLSGLENSSTPAEVSP
jgi:hypothetical protein